MPNWPNRCCIRSRAEAGPKNAVQSGAGARRAVIPVCRKGRRAGVLEYGTPPQNPSPQKTPVAQEGPARRGPACGKAGNNILFNYSLMFNIVNFCLYWTTCFWQKKRRVWEKIKPARGAGRQRSRFAPANRCLSAPAPYPSPFIKKGLFKALFICLYGRAAVIPEFLKTGSRTPWAPRSRFRVCLCRTPPPRSSRSRYRSSPDLR